MAQPSVSNQPGALRIPGMILGEEIGRGAESVVFRATRDGRNFAVKIHHAEKEEASLRLRREAAFTARLRHPGLAAIMEVGESGSRSWLIMEYVEGKTLAEVLKAGPLDEASIVSLARLIGGALGEVHRFGMVHRDVKPQNILMPSPQEAKLIDFGFAKQAQAETEDYSEEVVGTFLYSAPEQTGMLKRPLDGRADLYALGVVLFECATGAPPFQAQNVGELLRKHAVEVPRNVRELNYLISPALAAIIAKLLAKDPDDRYQTAAGLLWDLQNLDLLNQAMAEQRPVVLGQGDERAEVLYEVPLIGREEELGTLKRVWQRTLRGKGGCVLVEGQPGTGKSRLVRELLETARKDQALVLTGKASLDSVPFGPLRQALDGYLRRIRRLPEGERRRLEEGIREAAGEFSYLLQRFSPRLAAILTDLEDSPTMEASDASDMFYGAVADFLLRLGNMYPATVLFLDDVQWLDEGSRIVLKNMQERIKESPFLLAVTARNDPESLPKLNRFTSEMSAILSERLVTEPLSGENIHQLVKYHLGGGSVDQSVLRQLESRTGGNPFAIGEYVRAMLDAGVLTPSWGRWLVNAGEMERLHLSDDAIQLVIKRIEGLEEQVKQVLTIAALLGSKFPVAPLIALCGGQDKIVFAVITRAVQEHLIEYVEEGYYAFVHDRIQEALQANLSQQQQRTLHQLIAEALDSGEIEGPEQLMALARHYAQGDVSKNPKRVYETNLEAGMSALEEFAADDAYVFLQQASAAARLAGIEPDVSFYQTLGAVCARTSRVEEAKQNFQIAIQRTPDRLRRARIRAALISVLSANYEIDTAWEQAMRGFSEARYLWPRVRLLKPSAGIFYDIANWFSKRLGLLVTLFYFFWGLMIRWTRIGYGTARGRSRERYSTIAQILENVQKVSFFRVDSFAVFQVGLRGLFIANRLGPSRELVVCYTNYAVALSIMSNTPFGTWRWLIKISRFYLDATIRIAEQLGDRGLLAFAKAFDGYAAQFRGELVEAEAKFTALFKDYTRWLHPEERQKSMIALAANLQIRGYESEGALWGRRAADVLLNAVNEAEAGEKNYPLIYTVGALAVTGQPREALQNFQKVEKNVHYFTKAIYVKGVICAQTLHYFLHQEEFGPEMEKVVEEYEGLGLQPTGPFYLRLFHLYHAYIRFRLCTSAPANERARRLEAFRMTLESLEYSTEPAIRCHYLALAGAYAWMDGDIKEAQVLWREAETLSVEADNPWAHFEILRIKARFLIERGQNTQAVRLLRIAASLAAQHGWTVLARQIQKEFGVVAAAASSTSTSIGPVSIGPTSIGPTSIGPTSIGPTSVGPTSVGPTSTSSPSSQPKRSSSSKGGTLGTHTVSRSPIHLQRQLDALLQVSLASASVLDPDLQARVVLDEIVRILGAERAYLFLIEEGNDRLLLKAGRDAAGNDIEKLVAYSSTMIERVLDTRAPVVFTGNEDGEVVASESVVAHNLRSIMAAPLMRRDQLVGVIYLDNRLAKGLFSDEDVEILLGLGNHIAVALETAQMAKLEKERAEIEKDLAVTATVQALLLPKSNSEDWGNVALAGFYRPASQSGGDWWWYERRPDGKLLVLLGDVTGHGVGSAMVTATVASNYFTLRRRREAQDPATLLRDLNTSLHELCGGSYNMTLSIIEIDPARYQVRWWSAGAPPLLVLRRDGRVAALSSKGTPLGGSFLEVGLKRYTLQAGDRILVFSDGLTEAETKSGRPFGLRRLQSLLQKTQGKPTEESLNYVISNFEEVCNSDLPQEDDISLVVVDLR